MTRTLCQYLKSASLAAWPLDPIKVGGFAEKGAYKIFLRDFELVEDKVNPLQFDNNEAAWKSSWQDGDFEVKNGHFLTQKELRIKFVPRVQKSK